MLRTNVASCQNWVECHISYLELPDRKIKSLCYTVTVVEGSWVEETGEGLSGLEEHDNDISVKMEQVEICSHNPAAGLLKPLWIPSQIWEDISIAFIIDSRTCPVFHVSQLKKVSGDYSLKAAFPEELEVGVGRFSCVLASREIIKCGSPIRQWFVMWKGDFNHDTTWEYEPIR
ncbi:hypothetical protein L195_g002782 [Trifolium pratense]|uniref:Chromo domain-containing protein n=1 Tax=Trifolium pratense TaxID=57577 RepID=A0A2K3NTF7_TRIPR|nr:hypothetical protein L195_g002782 [Trifolium pratense]